MPALLQRMAPRTTAVLFQRIGIYDAAELMTLVPAGKLLRTLDESIWKSPRPGARERVDVDELIEWLQTWHDIGESFLLERLDAMSDDYLVLLLSYLIRVDTETQQHPEYGEVFDAFVEERPEDGERFGPFDVRMLQGDHADVTRATLHALWLEAPERLLRVFGRLSHAQCDPAAQRGWITTSLDVEFERQSFREAQGYVAADGARAFLAFAAGLTLEQIRALSHYDLETRRHLDQFGNAVAAASPVNTSEPQSASEEQAPVGSEPATQEPVRAESIDALQALLEDAELLEPVAEQLRLTGAISDEPPLTQQLRELAAADETSFQARGRELAYLANVLKTAASVADAALSDEQAKAAAFAICNLGVELEPDAMAWHEEPGLIRAFLFGWSALRRIPEHTVAALQQAAAGLTSWIGDEAGVGIADLQAALAARNWQDARNAMVFLSIAFDTASCRAIAALLDEIPRYSALLEGSKQPEAARWISSKTDLEHIAMLLANVALKRQGSS